MRRRVGSLSALSFLHCWSLLFPGNVTPFIMGKLLDATSSHLAFGDLLSATNMPVREYSCQGTYISLTAVPEQAKGQSSNARRAAVQALRFIASPRCTPARSRTQATGRPPRPSCTTSVPSDASSSPANCLKPKLSPRKSQASTPIWMSMVLLMMLGSVAESRYYLASRSSVG